MVRFVHLPELPQRILLRVSLGPPREKNVAGVVFLTGRSSVIAGRVGAGWYFGTYQYFSPVEESSPGVWTRQRRPGIATRGAAASRQQVTRRAVPVSSGPELPSYSSQRWPGGIKPAVYWLPFFIADCRLQIAD
jgi:hypothetical protein